MYEYCVMHTSHPEPHRRPDPYYDEEQQRQWCESWVQECVDEGFEIGAFYVSRREVSNWERV